MWMRTSALPKFRKLYGVIEEDLRVDETMTMFIRNNYNTYTFGGKKSIVLSTTTWLGGKNDFLGYSYIVTGSMSIFMSILFALIHVKYPRYTIRSHFFLVVLGHKNLTHRYCISARRQFSWSSLSLMAPLVFDELAGRKVILIAYHGTGKTAVTKEPVSVRKAVGTSPANIH